METANFLEKLASQFGATASVKNVFGEPIKAGDKTIIPVARIAYGLGGGYGKEKNRNKNNHANFVQEPSAPVNQKGDEGAGAGGGVYARPAGVYEVTSSGTRFIPVNNIMPMLAGICIGFLLRGICSKGRRK